MATWARIRLVSALGLLLLALVPWGAQAGTADDPEFTDDEGDPEVQGTVPIGEVFLVSDGIDIINGWVEENDTALTLALEMAGSVQFVGQLTVYEFIFHLTAGATEHTATATWDGAYTAGGVATGVAAEGSVLRMTVPKSAVEAFRGDTLTGLYAETTGTLVTDPLFSVLDRAPDSGSGRDYNVTQGLARGGTSSDQDGDGLADAWETQHFGNATLHNGTGDPDGDGLNNTREQAIGTDPGDADTDGDFLQDGVDSSPLDPTQPSDSDGDGLNDSWERKHFSAIDAQDGEGNPDGDGLHNHEELEAGTDPNKSDTDGDGVTDEADSDPLDPNESGTTEVGGSRDVKPELYAGAGLFALAATFILLGLAKGI